MRSKHGLTLTSALHVRPSSAAQTITKSAAKTAISSTITFAVPAIPSAKSATKSAKTAMSYRSPLASHEAKTTFRRVKNEKMRKKRHSYTAPPLPRRGRGQAGVATNTSGHICGNSIGHHSGHIPRRAALSLPGKGVGVRSATSPAKPAIVSAPQAEAMLAPESRKIPTSYRSSPSCRAKKRQHRQENRQCSGNPPPGAHLATLQPAQSHARHWPGFAARSANCLPIDCQALATGRGFNRWLATPA